MLSIAAKEVRGRGCDRNAIVCCMKQMLHGVLQERWCPGAMAGSSRHKSC
jgi:hypothetical protein